MKSILCTFLLLAVSAAMAQPSLHFIENKGQWDSRAKFLLQSGHADLWLTDSGMVYDLYRYTSPISRKLPVTRTGHVIRINFLNSSRAAVIASNPDSGNMNYFIGNDPEKWVQGARSFKGVTMESLYPGIDAVFSLENGVPRYDLVVLPGSDPSQIQMRVEGADSIFTRNGNELTIAATVGTIQERALAAYQIIDGVKKSIPCRFAISENNSVSFQLGAFDSSSELIIDPLIFSTFLGQGGISALTIDRFGNSYVTGWTASQTFPITTGAYQTTNNGQPGYNAFVTKMNATGTALVYSTYLGGSAGYHGDGGSAIAVDSVGNAYITGITGSTDFPVTKSAYQRKSKALNPNYENAFVTKLNPTGSVLLYSTYLGGSNGLFDGQGEEGTGIAIDSIGEAYIVGNTSSSDFPVTPGAFQTTNGAFTYNIESEGEAAFVAKFNAIGSQLLYSTYLGGSKPAIAQPYPSIINTGEAIALDKSGNAFITGATNAADFPVSAGAFQPAIQSDSEFNAYVTELNPRGSTAMFSTYLGGSHSDGGEAIALDSLGDAFVTGTTFSTDFPVTTGAFQTALKGESDFFVTKVNPSGTALLYSTYLGSGSEAYSYYYDFNYTYDRVVAIAVDRFGDAFIAGGTDFPDFPTLPGAVQATYRDSGDAFISELNKDGSALLYSTFLGGISADAADAIAVDSIGAVYVAGTTGSTDFPITPGVFDTNTPGSFIAKLSPLTRYLLADTALRDFGIGSLCRTADTSIVIANAGSDTLFLKSVSLAGGNFYIVSPPPVGTLLPGERDTLTIAYTPQLGTDTGHLTIESDAANDSTMVIALAARTVQPPSLDLQGEFSRTGVKQNDTVTYYLLVDSTVSGSGLNTLEMTLNYDGDVLTLQNMVSMTGTLQSAVNVSGSIASLHLTLSGINLQFDKNVPCAAIVFQTALSDSVSTQVTIGDPIINASDSLYSKCVLSALGSATEFSIASSCSDSLIRSALNGRLELAIKTIRPNPTSSDITIETEGATTSPIVLKVFNELGTLIFTQVQSQPGIIHLDGNILSSGIYRLNVSNGFSEAHGCFIVEK